jgi:transcriptional regulator with XRE-family HTH domain
LIFGSKFPTVTVVHSEAAMTPFGRLLRAYRQDFGMAQGEFARRLGYRQSYISAIERGGKLPKDDKLVDAAVATFGLDPSNEVMLRQAFQLSQPSELPPPGTPFFAYHLCPQISAVMPKLTVSQTRAFQAFLADIQLSQTTRAIETDRPENALEGDFQ